MITFNLDIFDPFKNTPTYADNYLKWLMEPSVPLVDIVNYINALNQVHLGVFYKHFNGEVAKFFGIKAPYRQKNDFIADPFFNLVVNYQQENFKNFFNKMLTAYSTQTF